MYVCMYICCISDVVHTTTIYDEAGSHPSWPTEGGLTWYTPSECKQPISHSIEHFFCFAGRKSELVGALQKSQFNSFTPYADFPLAPFVIVGGNKLNRCPSYSCHFLPLILPFSTRREDSLQCLFPNLVKVWFAYTRKTLQQLLLKRDEFGCFFL